MSQTELRKVEEDEATRWTDTELLIGSLLLFSILLLDLTGFALLMLVFGFACIAWSFVIQP